MDTVVRKALAKRADDRYQSAQEFAEAIRAAVASTISPGVGAAAAPGATRDVSPKTNAAAMTSGAEATVLAASDPTVVAAPSGTVGNVPAPVAGKGRKPALAIVLVSLLVAIGMGTSFIYLRKPADSGPATSSAQPTSPPASAAHAPAAGASAPSPSTPTLPAAGVAAPGTAASTPTAAAPPPTPGTMVISAVGLVDPSDPRYQSDTALLQADLRADSRSQAVAKALGLMLEPASYAKNYDVLRDRLLSQSGDFVKTVVRESAPRTGKDGLASLTTEAVVNVKAVQKALNQLTREQRLQVIRASGDPRISVQIGVRDADRPDAPPQPSPIAENVLKERIKSFGFRTWSEGAPGGGGGPDFAVVGEAKVKRLSARLEASGVVITKFTLSSWTVKCVDRATGEEIYYNTALPKGVGSWTSEEEALKAIGAKIADEFSRDFFLQHAAVASRPIVLVVEGIPDAATAEALSRELVGLPDVIGANPHSGSGPLAFDLQLGGHGPPGDVVGRSVLKPLNAKLGKACFGLGASTGNQLTIVLEKSCADAGVLSRLETYPPAALYDAPPGRQKAVIRNPETLRKLTI
jgi:serine/threonine-protein kinase